MVPCKRQSRPPPQGLALLELLIGLALLGMVFTKLLEHSLQQAFDLKATAQARALKRIAAAATSYGRANYLAVSNNTSVPGFENPRQPTVPELSAGGFLPSSFGVTGYFGGTYVVRLFPSANSIGGYVLADTPLIFAGNTNASAIGRAVLEMGADGAASLPEGAMLRGLGGSWKTPNPVAGTPIGVLAMRIGPILP